MATMQQLFDHFGYSRRFARNANLVLCMPCRLLIRCTLALLDFNGCHVPRRARFNLAPLLYLHRGKDLASTAAFWTARFPRPPSKVLVSDFFGAVMDAGPHKKVLAVSSTTFVPATLGLCTHYL